MAKAPLQTGGGGTKKISPGAFTITRMGGSSRSKYLNLLAYGKHGAGKSTLLGSAVDVEDMRDVLVVTAEGGTIVYEDNPMIKNPELLDIIEINRMEQFQKVYEFLKSHIALRDDPEKEDQLKSLQEMVFGEIDERGIRKYRTVIVDSLSEIEAANLAKIMNLDALGLDAGEDMEVAGFAEFRKNNHIMQRIVRQFRDLDIHVLMTCAEAFSQDERKAFHYAPKLTGQLTGIIQGFFDVVGWLVVGTAGEGETSAPRRLFVQPQSRPKADAKCRLAAYKKDHFDNPTMSKIMKDTGFIKG
jgi:hypothetical protein